ncbi:hypothetical protein CERSUDRAFT_118432 [Gelatoporia subvermispora B]|uniref:F-box domain-containing protein n=1 Tax=Ceriporiopsis subvermispora (strain B) TaxID=914234 RepID=M2QLJ7_CERS8|nr:hypothetical protein CERSUDRAFT_118432 [Gelatoporia subvermispora B]
MSASPISEWELVEQSKEKMAPNLSTLPYDLLLNIAQHLDVYDVQVVQITCRALHDFAITRPVYRHLAVKLLRRCRALPLPGFQRLSDLTTEQLIATVTKATRLERAWLTRAPRPVRSGRSPYLEDSGAPSDTVSKPRWYKVINSPPDEEVDWLSPITSSYSLCATKSGKVVCWDVHRNACIAQWDPFERWELWKCRVEFEQRTVFFTMAKVLRKMNHDDRHMQFVLMQLQFPESHGQGTDTETPAFSRLATFNTLGVVMNVFLLDPATRLLSAFVWVSTTNTIGLYTLLDWDKREYVFIDTGIECSMSSNWSCILYKEHIVIHAEESEAAHQYFFPLSLLQHYAQPYVTSETFVPKISGRVAPTRNLKSPFYFPSLPARPLSPTSSDDDDSDDDTAAEDEDEARPPSPTALAVAQQPAATPQPASQHTNPFPFPPWYPESAHFVRQWWPSVINVPKMSCTVVLLADHDPVSHRTRYVLAQHYFRVPLLERGGDEAYAEPSPPSSDTSSDTLSLTAGGEGSAQGSDAPGPTPVFDPLMRIWYVSEPFEVVCVLDSMDDEDEDAPTERPRPLMAVDFGHAVWIEYVNSESGDVDAKRLRFVTFPPLGEQVLDPGEDSQPGEDHWLYKDAASRRPTMEGEVWTLEIPEELNLDHVETINIDQSQGSVIISVKNGNIFILCYE